jgi:hypothetical protein
MVLAVLLSLIATIAVLGVRLHYVAQYPAGRRYNAIMNPLVFREFIWIYMPLRNGSRKRFWYDIQRLKIPGMRT